MTDVPQWRVRCLVWERCRNQRNCGILIAGGAGIKNCGFLVHRNVGKGRYFGFYMYVQKRVYLNNLIIELQ